MADVLHWPPGTETSTLGTDDEQQKVGYLPEGRSSFDFVDGNVEYPTQTGRRPEEISKALNELDIDGQFSDAITELHIWLDTQSQVVLPDESISIRTAEFHSTDYDDLDSTEVRVECDGITQAVVAAVVGDSDVDLGEPTFPWSRVSTPIPISIASGQTEVLSLTPEVESFEEADDRLTEDSFVSERLESVGFNLHNDGTNPADFSLEVRKTEYEDSPATTSGDSFVTSATDSWPQNVAGGEDAAVFNDSVDGKEARVVVTAASGETDVFVAGSGRNDN